MAYLTVFCSTTFWFVFTGIPCFLYTGLVSAGNSFVCSYLSQSFASYNNIFFIPIVYCLLPISILSIAGILTWKNIRRLRRRIIRQFARMMFLQILSTVLTTAPLCIAAIYLAATTYTKKSSLQKTIESLAITICQLCFYLAYSCNFYIYLLSSNRIRQIVLKYCVTMARKILRIVLLKRTGRIAVIPVNQWIAISWQYWQDEGSVIHSTHISLDVILPLCHFGFSN